MKIRMKETFETGWKFHLGDWKIIPPVKSGMAGGITDCENIEDGEWLKIAYFDERPQESVCEEEWMDVSLPHDWCVEGDYYNDEGAVKHHKSHGYLYGGIGFYRKEFSISQELLGKKTGIEFDGVFRKSTVWVNGHRIMHHESGYTGFYCDLTDVIRYGETGRNVIVVRVDAREYEGWWYEGAGIYRHVWLIATDRIHVKRHGTCVTTPKVEAGCAQVQIETVVLNEHFENRNCRVIFRISDRENQLLAEAGMEKPIGTFKEEKWKCTLDILQPELWSPETPYLYKVVTEVYEGEELRDIKETNFGVRTLAFDSDRGFLLNGRPYVIKGTCNHQDFAGVGVALPDKIIEYKLKLLKEMGCNAYRSAHHPATPELLDICDRIGMLVMDENRKLDSSETGIRELREMIYRGRNHACIFMWSMENEEILEGTIMGARILKTLSAVTHSIDPTRPVTAAMNHGWNDCGYSDGVDVTGYNYGQREGQDIHDHILFPERCMIGSESASCTVTRGIYERDNKRGYCPEYGTYIPEWSCSVEKAWTDVAEHSFLSGVFIWTGFDYRGEPTPYEWPNINSHFGIMDTCGFPKDNYYYLKSQWCEEPTLHILPHWNWSGEEGIEKDVWVYSNLLQIELFLNGKSLGKKVRRPHGHLEWKVPYEAGEIRAEGYSNGEWVITETVVTAGMPYQIKAEADKMYLSADGNDVSCIRISVTDKYGNPMPVADNKITFSVKGAAKIIGTGNGDPSSHEPDKAMEKSMFSGKCMLIIQSNGEEGEILVTASSKGLKDCIITLAGKAI